MNLSRKSKVVVFQREKENQFSAEKPLSWIQCLTRQTRIRQKISLGYALAVGIAVLISVMQGYMNFQLSKIANPTQLEINQAMLDGINLSFFVGSIFMAIGLLTALFLKPAYSTENLEDGITSVRPISESHKVKRKEQD